MFRNILDERVINLKSYLSEWIKLIFTNKIVLMNIIGNILLFIPFIVLFKKMKISIFASIIYTILIIISMELLQFLTKRGIFDIVDVYLNCLGILLASLVRFIEVKLL